MINTEGEHSRSNCNSAIHVAKLLNTEGFSEYTANEVKRYALKSCTTERQRERWKSTKKAFGMVMNDKLDERDRIVVGKFISMIEHMGFDTGLRIGITAFLYGAHIDPSDVINLGKQYDKGSKCQEE